MLNMYNLTFNEFTQINSLLSETTKDHESNKNTSNLFSYFTATATKTKGEQEMLYKHVWNPVQGNIGQHQGTLDSVESVELITISHHQCQMANTVPFLSSHSGTLNSSYEALTRSNLSIYGAALPRQTSPSKPSCSWGRMVCKL